MPADSLFLRPDGPDTIAVALYHDQGMIPAKMMSQGHAVNCTLGLPFLRTAPDHGPAFDIAGTEHGGPERVSGVRSWRGWSCSSAGGETRDARRRDATKRR